MQNAEISSHAGKAQFYDFGRPAYPEAFYDWLYDTFQFSVIADIGCGPGKTALEFARRGSRVYAVEPDPDMRAIAGERLGSFGNSTLLGTSAEATKIPSASVDLIFCGNSYYWFDRVRAIPEFRRILKPGGDANVLLAWQRGRTENRADLPDIKRFYRPHDSRHDESPPFREGTFQTRDFDHTIEQDWAAHLGGVLSASVAPGPDDGCFEEFCNIRKQYFDQYSRDGLIQTRFRLTCMYGSVNDLL